MSNWGLKITTSGKDISSTNVDDYIFSSKYSSVKIALQGSGSIQVNASSSSDVTITHSLGFVPIVMLYTELTPGSGRWRFSCPLSFYNSSEECDVDNDSTYTYADTTEFKFRVNNSVASSRTVSYYYYILGDSGNN